MPGNKELVHKRIHGHAPEVWQAVVAAGLADEGDYVYRVKLDIAADGAVKVDIYKYADDRVTGFLRHIGEMTEWENEP